jgi:hypothetical protein
MAISDQVQHHTVNVVAVSLPAVSFMAQAPGYVTLIVGILGGIWYCILIAEKIYNWRRKK